MKIVIDKVYETNLLINNASTLVEATWLGSCVDNIRICGKVLISVTITFAHFSMRIKRKISTVTRYRKQTDRFKIGAYIYVTDFMGQN